MDMSAASQQVGGRLAPFTGSPACGLTLSLHAVYTQSLLGPPLPHQSLWSFHVTTATSPYLPLPPHCTGSHQALPVPRTAQYMGLTLSTPK